MLTASLQTAVQALLPALTAGTGSCERDWLLVNSPRMLDLIPEDSALDKLSGGFIFTEGPAWSTIDNCLFFSDIPGNKVYRWRAEDGVSIFLEPSGNSNGLTMVADGGILLCEQTERRVSRYHPNGEISLLATHFGDKRLNSPNDVVFKSDGAIYFTDPPYGVAEHLREIDYQGVFRMETDGTLRLLVDDFDRPNGLAFSPDESLLYITDSSERSHIRVFDVDSDGMISNGRLFAELKGPEPGVPDGMRVDADGNVWSTGPGGVWVYDSNGVHLGTIRIPEVAANCEWGDADAGTLFITATSGLYRVRTNARGARR